jgi:hypothetical protein
VANATLKQSVVPLPCQYVGHRITQIVGKRPFRIGFVDIDQWMGKLCSGAPRGLVALFIEADMQYNVVAYHGIAKNRL